MKISQSRFRLLLSNEFAISFKKQNIFLRNINNDLVYAILFVSILYSYSTHNFFTMVFHVMIRMAFLVFGTFNLDVSIKTKLNLKLMQIMRRTIQNSLIHRHTNRSFPSIVL